MSLTAFTPFKHVRDRVRDRAVMEPSADFHTAGLHFRLSQKDYRIAGHRVDQLPHSHVYRMAFGQYVSHHVWNIECNVLHPQHSFQSRSLKLFEKQSIIPSFLVIWSYVILSLTCVHCNVICWWKCWYIEWKNKVVMVVCQEVMLFNPVLLTSLTFCHSFYYRQCILNSDT